MAKFVPDTKTRRWVILSPGRQQRPDEGASHAEVPPSGTKECPFCPGNEHLTPPEVYRIGNGETNQSGWEVRVVPNKYPITDIHEVIIHSPSDEMDLEDLPVTQVEKIITCYRDRYQANESNGQVLIFCNHGFGAGASLKHPHSQLAVIPQQINLDTLAKEPVTNLVEETGNFFVYCPDFSQWPYEVWFSPKQPGKKFGEINQAEISDLAKLLKNTLQKLAKIRAKDGNFIYNFYIYHGVDWYLRLTPRFVHRAGFELGTGLNVNVVDPSQAAEVLRRTLLLKS